MQYPPPVFYSLFLPKKNNKKQTSFPIYFTVKKYTWFAIRRLSDRCFCAQWFCPVTTRVYSPSVSCFLLNQALRHHQWQRAERHRCWPVCKAACKHRHTRWLSPTLLLSQCSRVSSAPHFGVNNGHMAVRHFRKLIPRISTSRLSLNQFNLLWNLNSQIAAKPSITDFLF